MFVRDKMRILALSLCTVILLAAQLLPVSAQDCNVVGTWNLEHFGENKSRGFPEISGQLGPRTNAQLDGIATSIRDTIRAKVLVLNEINGLRDEARSAELDDLMGRLGPSWRYSIARSGGSQRNAIIWDSEHAEMIAQYEIEIAKEKVEGKDIFERDPLAAYFRFLQDGMARNDLLVVALHLASGQQHASNHDAAMARLRGELKSLRGRDPVLPREEDDIFLAGDLNANPYEAPTEAFFTSFNRGNWKLLADGPNYPATRINGSQIDYIIVTRRNSRQQGLWGEEIDTGQATVWNELAVDGLDAFRRDYSDHFPVTACIAVTDDRD